MSRCKACDRVLLSTSLKTKRKNENSAPIYEDLCTVCISLTRMFNSYDYREHDLDYLNNPLYVLSQEQRLIVEEM